MLTLSRVADGAIIWPNVLLQHMINLRPLFFSFSLDLFVIGFSFGVCFLWSCFILSVFLFILRTSDYFHCFLV